VKVDETASNAIKTKDNEMINSLSFIIYCLNCIRRDRNSTYKTGLTRTGFPWGGARGSLTAHSPLQSATLLSQHYHYLKWRSLHVRRSVLHYLLFISAFYPDSCCSTVLSTVNLHVKVQYIWLYNNLDMFTYLTMMFN
jgi:hypothetical protein